MANLSEWSQAQGIAQTDAALQWIKQSFEACDNGGSAHSWHPLRGWSKAYPETSGYLIETLLRYAQLKQDDSLRMLALKCARWLDGIQLPSGAFPGLLEGHKQPSVFNTSQILFAAPHLNGADRALEWLLSSLDSDGAWRQAAFVPGFVPSYYTRAIWGVLQANESIKHPDVEALMRKALDFYARRFMPNNAIAAWGFRPQAPAFTHTIAYTLEGFWESAGILGAEEITRKTLATVDQLLAVRKAAGGRTAGRYSEHWEGDYSFRCITGNFQLSQLCYKIWQQTSEPAYLEASDAFLLEVLHFQNKSQNKNRFGAFPGSVPFWGAYLPFRYPNWTQKFFLDAMYPRLCS